MCIDNKYINLPPCSIMESLNPCLMFFNVECASAILKFNCISKWWLWHPTLTVCFDQNRRSCFHLEVFWYCNTAVESICYSIYLEEKKI